MTHRSNGRLNTFVDIFQLTDAFILFVKIIARRGWLRGHICVATLLLLGSHLFLTLLCLLFAARRGNIGLWLNTVFGVSRLINQAEVILAATSVIKK